MTPSREELIRGLAILRDADPIAYAQERKLVAAKLGVGVAFLDEAVEREIKRLAEEARQHVEEPPDTDELLALGGDILGTRDILARVRPVFRELGYAGPTAPAELAYLAFHSRLLERPVNLLLEGPSAAGKTHTEQTAARLHPPEAIHDLTGCSERALVYTERDFRHKVVVIAEAAALHADGIGASIIRSIAWGNGVQYETVEKVEGKLVARLVEKPGPTGLLTTTTKPLDPEIATRMLAVPIDESPEITRSIMRAQAAAAVGEDRDPPDVDAWIAAARWIEHAGEHRVVVPFATELAEIVPDNDVRLRRDFSQVLSLVKTVALLHQRTRGLDQGGRIVADESDYEAVRHLLADVLAASIDAVPDTVRETIAAVEELLPGHAGGVPVTALADRLDMNRTSAFRRAKIAMDKGFLTNLEERPRRPLKLTLGDPLPAKRVVLPSLYPLQNDCNRATDPRGTVAPLHEFQGGLEEDTIDLWDEGGRDTLEEEP